MGQRNIWVLRMLYALSCWKTLMARETICWVNNELMKIKWRFWIHNGMFVYVDMSLSCCNLLFSVRDSQILFNYLTWNSSTSRWLYQIFERKLNKALSDSFQKKLSEVHFPLKPKRNAMIKTLCLDENKVAERNNSQTTITVLTKDYV